MRHDAGSGTKNSFDVKIDTYRDMNSYNPARDLCTWTIGLGHELKDLSISVESRSLPVKSPLIACQILHVYRSLEYLYLSLLLSF